MLLMKTPILMKTKFITSILGAFLLAMPSFAQDKTTVRANSSDISDNLDLRAVATIFGDAKDLEDFENRLNDPKAQISNLDLNNDNYVDYLRVIESVEGNAHIIIIQAVLDKDLFQDIATVEVERDGNNNVQVQVVGDVYMYGSNYIYEPVYVHRPVIYTTFWVTNYHPYHSAWYWGYYPSFYYYWNPFPIFRYRNHIALHINYGHTYHYVTTRRCSYAYNAYYGRRANGYERRYPNRSFTSRNSGYSNRHELDQNRTIKTRVAGSRELAQNTPRTSSSSPRSNTITSSPRNTNVAVTPRTTNSSSPRSNSGTVEPRSYSTTPKPRNSGTTSSSVSEPRTTTGSTTPKPRTSTSTPRNYSEPRSTSPSVSSPRSSGSSSTRNYSTPRSSNSSMSTPRSSGSSGTRSSSSSRGGRS